LKESKVLVVMEGILSIYMSYDVFPRLEKK